MDVCKELSLGENIDPFARASNVRACSECLVLTQFIRLGEPVCFYSVFTHVASIYATLWEQKKFFT